MNKQFKKTHEGLRVKVTQEDKIFLPTETGKKEIGTYEQTTIQNIKREEIDTLVNFVEAENGKAQANRDKVQEQYDSLKEFDENISEEFLTTTTAAIKEAADKAKFMKPAEVAEGAEPAEEFDAEAHEKVLGDLNNLSQFIQSVQRKKSLKTQLEFLDKQLKQGGKELADLKEAIAN